MTRQDYCLKALSVRSSGTLSVDIGNAGHPFEKRQTALAKVLCSFIWLGAITASAQTTVSTGRLKLEDGTPVKLRLQRTISSADASVDERIDFDVLEEVRVNGVLVIPKGSIAWATVTAAQPERPIHLRGRRAIRGSARADPNLGACLHSDDGTISGVTQDLTLYPTRRQKQRDLGAVPRRWRACRLEPCRRGRFCTPVIVHFG